MFMQESTMRREVKKTGWSVKRICRDTNYHGVMSWRVDIIDDSGECLVAFGSTRNEAYVNIIALSKKIKPRVLKQEYRA